MEDQTRSYREWETTKSRVICIVRGFLQGDSYSPVGFCLTQVPACCDAHEGYGWVYDGTGRGTRCEKNTQSVFR